MATLLLICRAQNMVISADTYRLYKVEELNCFFLVLQPPACVMMVVVAGAWGSWPVGYVKRGSWHVSS